MRFTAPRSVLRFAPAAFALAVAAVAVGCGGGGGSSGGGGGTPPTTAPTTAPTAVPTATPVALPSQAAFAPVSTTAAFPAAAGGSYAVAVPTNVPYPTSISFPASGANVPAGTNVTSTLTNVQPAGLPVISSFARSVQSTRSPQLDAPPTVIEFVQLLLTQTATFANGPSITVGLPSSFAGVSGVAYWAALCPGSCTSWTYGIPATVMSGNSVSFVITPLTTVTANVTYTIGIYAISASAPTPSPAPTSSAPAPTPTPAFPVAAPTTVAFTSLSATPAPVTVTEAGYTGNFSVTIPSGTCSPAPSASPGQPVTVSPASAANPATFNVTPVTAGACLLVFSDSAGRSATVNAGVTLTTGIIQVVPPGNK